uniref:Cystatin domain-containing protein n=1 Tax=Oryzias latipes TaxID=8090 RepID=A0A3B3IJD1_ORYLA
MSCGGLSEMKVANKDIQEICDLVNKVEEKLGKHFHPFTPVSYRIQIVHGGLYYIKVRTGWGWVVDYRGGGGGFQHILYIH